jgi:lipoprotein NlpD
MRRRGYITLFLLAFVLFAVAAEEGIHVLLRNETIYGIARSYGLSADTLLAYNNITDDQARSLPIGFRLRIPGTYVVKEGEYPFSIARSLGVNWLELLEANGLGRDSVVRPGDVLLIPGRVTNISGDSSQEESGNGIGEIAQSDTSAGSNAGTVRLPTDSTEGIEWPHLGERLDYDGRFTGVVIKGSSGDEIRSVTPGQVSYVGPFTGFGRIVIVQSRNGYQYVYMGSETALVEIGDLVEVGTTLGLVGYTPSLDDTDVLFTVWNGNSFVHPSVAPRG